MHGVEPYRLRLGLWLRISLYLPRMLILLLPRRIVVVIGVFAVPAGSFVEDRLAPLTFEQRVVDTAAAAFLTSCAITIDGEKGFKRERRERRFCCCCKRPIIDDEGLLTIFSVL